MKTLLALASALILLAGCDSDSKKEDAKPSGTPKTLTCTIEGRSFSRTAKARFQAASASTANRDVLSISTDAPPAGSPNEYVTVFFNKAPGAPNSDYKLTSVYYDATTNATIYEDEGPATLSKTASGWSGTFSASITRPSGVVLKVENGVFTDIPE
ncbi:hypothetical protein F0P96_10605 [Hymenobacter busanensis]|uniref:Uncharacterized protein n=1 Tax=Hymenobacter busanensis TaxID=2607656 RepID=A0A7L4ZWN4_9BACT|nr:hypothetical protein [Hymenobacter busanensis]KAA9333411.1 hypothetical protein F0P96_10605 [Hymenobacter busanensis]QHJ07909.1 hypothetical protein GUY19_11700 [Hymenobacter busanensis]